MKLVFNIIRNCLAVIGLFVTIGAFVLLVLLVNRADLPPVMLAEKIIDKGIEFVTRTSAAVHQKSLANPAEFRPSGLSPHVSVEPFNESLFHNRRILRVGPTRSLKVPSEAAREARPNDIIEIDAGVYVGDVVLWRVPGLTIRGVGGRAILDAGGRSIQGKAIWVIQAKDILVENIGFKNCRVRDRNGAGIRVEADNLVIQNCLFWENENGVMCGNIDSISSLTIRYSEFGFNGYGDGYSHGVYVGTIDEFIFEFNYVHHTKSGHQVKSRARFNRIAYNLLTDHEKGNSSYAIDLQDGGKAVVIGNVLHQSNLTENSALIHYGKPNSTSGQPIYIINNTASSDRWRGIFLLNHSPAESVLFNNLLIGKLKTAVGKSRNVKNLTVSKSCLVPSPPSAPPYQLDPDCEAVDAGFVFSSTESPYLIPEFEYVHPLSKHTRRMNEVIDIGAYESR